MTKMSIPVLAMSIALFSSLIISSVSLIIVWDNKFEIREISREVKAKTLDRYYGKDAKADFGKLTLKIDELVRYCTINQGTSVQH